VDSDHLLQNRRKYGLDISFELWLSPVALCHISPTEPLHSTPSRHTRLVTGYRCRVEVRRGTGNNSDANSYNRNSVPSKV
jgi:hypothetical protein